MELGGNAPFIVFGDADLDAAVEGAMAAKMRNMGEACTAANRFLVHESVAQEFTRKFAAAMGALTTGRGTEPSTQVDPLIDAGARDDVHALVSAAVDARKSSGPSPPSPRSAVKKTPSAWPTPANTARPHIFTAATYIGIADPYAG